MAAPSVGFPYQPLGSHDLSHDTAPNFDTMPASYAPSPPDTSGGLELVHKSSATSRLAAVGNIFKAIGRGMGLVVGGVIATLGAVPAGLMKGVIYVAAFTGVVAGGLAGSLIGLAIGACKRKPVAGLKEGAEIGLTAGAIIGAAVAGFALGIPYTLAYAITKCGTKIMAASGASREETALFHIIAAMPKK